MQYVLERVRRPSRVVEITSFRLTKMCYSYEPVKCTQNTQEKRCRFLFQHLYGEGWTLFLLISFILWMLPQWISELHIMKVSPEAYKGMAKLTRIGVAEWRKRREKAGVE